MNTDPPERLPRPTVVQDPADQGTVHPTTRENENSPLRTGRSERGRPGPARAQAARARGRRGKHEPPKTRAGTPEGQDQG